MGYNGLAFIDRLEDLFKTEVKRPKNFWVILYALRLTAQVCARKWQHNPNINEGIRKQKYGN